MKPFMDELKSVAKGLEEVRASHLRRIMASGLRIMPSDHVRDGSPMILVSHADFKRMCEMTKSSEND